ncbi:MAG: peptidoglycan-binding domain-containing protein [Myxococcales bacterium]|nr:peptidoglycan-binding domain-containing protein [Myxococcales bacterium]
MRLGSGRPSIDFNGTKYTSIEGSAANSEISIGKKFNPLTQPGIALTTQQARELGVKVGDKVLVRDTKTGRTVEATFYDSAGSKRKDKLGHFEVGPALADALGINYRNKKGQVVDAVTNKEDLGGRYSIEKLNGTASSDATPAPAPKPSEYDSTARANPTRLGAFDHKYRAEPSAQDLAAGRASLSIGDKGESVKELQRKLGVKVDGYFGPITQRALTAAQKKLGVDNTSPDFGVASRETIDTLPARRASSRRAAAPASEEPTSNAPVDAAPPGSPASASRLVNTIRQVEREMPGTGRCAAAVNEAIRRTYRVPMSGNGNQVDNNLPRSHFRELNIPLEEALRRPGLVLTWERTNTRLGSRYGHTAITTGDGRTSVSDYTEGDTLAGSRRMGRQGLRVFEPIR